MTIVTTEEKLQSYQSFNPAQRSRIKADAVTARIREHYSKARTVNLSLYHSGSGFCMDSGCAVMDGGEGENFAIWDNGAFEPVRKPGAGGIIKRLIQSLKYDDETGGVPVTDGKPGTLLVSTPNAIERDLLKVHINDSRLVEACREVTQRASGTIGIEYAF